MRVQLFIVFSPRLSLLAEFREFVKRYSMYPLINGLFLKLPILKLHVFQGQFRACKLTLAVMKLYIAITYEYLNTCMIIDCCYDLRIWSLTSSVRARSQTLLCEMVIWSQQIDRKFSTMTYIMCMRCCYQSLSCC